MSDEMTADSDLDRRIAAMADLTPDEAVLRLAELGKEGVMPHLSALLDRRPDLWRYCGDLATATQLAWAQELARGHLLVRESIVRRMREMTAELLGPEPTALDRLVVPAVVSAWIAMQAADATDLDAATSDNPCGERAAVAMKRQEGQARRFQNAAKVLATVRKYGAGLKIEITHRGNPPGAPESEPGAVVRNGGRAGAEPGGRDAQTGEGLGAVGDRMSGLGAMAGASVPA